ncbi:MAG: replication-relaxation family protein [Pirellulaceae bacterium]|nr:replication-relaxation family protein [Pirellulaceae bacterium]
MRAAKAEHIRPIDQAVLDLLRQHQNLTVQDLTERLEVTATAVRQRLDRLEEVGLVGRSKESVGRGRPQFRYFLTALGMRYSSVSYAELAAALWAEVLDLPNPSLRSRILLRVARRMSQDLIHELPQDANVDDRLEEIVVQLARRKIPATLTPKGNMPVLHMLACPFPDLAGDQNQRHVCELEQEMLSAAVGQSVQLECCRLDGHEHCQFRPVAAVEPLPAESIRLLNENESLS